MEIKAVIFDWAGTTVDFGCNAPPAVLHAIFAARGIPLQPEEARHAMGLPKKDQIRDICKLPRVAAAWTEAHGAPPAEADVERLFEAFVPAQMECIERYSDVIEGVPALVRRLRDQGLRIGSTTGYTREMLDVILAKAARQGYAPDESLTPGEVGGGRPAPWMIFENLRRLSVYPPRACVKVGDTPSDIEEGRNAGAWTVGVTASSNEASLGGIEYARTILTGAGADFVIERITELEGVIDSLRSR